MSNDTKLKVVIPPHVLAEMENTFSPEELEQFLADFQKMVESGQIFEDSEPLDLDTLEQDDPELFAHLTKQMIDQGFDTLEDWLDAQSTPPTLN